MNRILSLIVLLIVLLKANAQEEIALNGRIVDAQTGEDLAGATIELLSQDSILISSQVADNHWERNEKEGHSADFRFNVPKQSATYILKASFLGYKTSFVSFSIGEIKKREFSRTLPPIRMPRESKMLDEVKVVGSKVKFYYKGDTIVYNADAFMLADGSMLDALVSQLPGVEIKKDGRIFHNGDYVESLLLNGKDFFKDNQQVMLENLPAYTVKSIKVYNKYGKKSEFLDKNIRSDKEYVMDVRLKRQYTMGTLANMEAGYGTHDRYMGRLFAMRYTNLSSFTLYGNMNNLNDNRKPGRDSHWTPDDTSRGENKEQKAGFDYSLSNKDGNFELNGNAEIYKERQYLEENVDKVNFLQQTNNYEYTRATSRGKDIHLSTSHYLDLMLNNVYLHLEPKFNYNKYNKNRYSIAGSFSEMPSDVSANILEHLYSLEMQDTLRQSVINRRRKQSLNKSQQFGGSIVAVAEIKFPQKEDYLTLSAKMDADYQKSDRFNDYVINYGKDEDNAESAYQYFKDRPNRHLSYRAFATYHYQLNKETTLGFGYGYQHHRKKNTSSLYLLDNDPVGELGLLSPGYEAWIDLSNSYNSINIEDEHYFTPSIEWLKEGEKWDWYISARLQAIPVRQELDYHRGSIDTTLVRNSIKLAAPTWIINHSNKDNTHVYQLTLDMQTQTPNLIDMVNMTDRTDPMNIRIGNTRLKNQVTYEANGIIRRNLKERQSMSTVRMKYKYTQNALTLGYCYDVQTGARTFRMDNTNGNWQIGVSSENEMPLDKKKSLFLHNKIGLNHYNSIGFIGTSTTNALQFMRNSVHTTTLDDNLKLEYNFSSSLQVSLKANGSWRYSDSKTEDFEAINAFDYSYGLAVSAKLPWHLHFSTDLTMYSRRGYTGSSMNTDNLIWNTRLSCSLLKKRLIATIDGFDILHQLSNVTRVVDAQGRTETYTNVLPNYVMLHLAFQFDINPRKY